MSRYGRTYTTKLVIAFRNFSKAPTNEKKIKVLILLIRSVHKLNMTEIKPSADADIGNYIFMTEIHVLP